MTDIIDIIYGNTKPSNDDFFENYCGNNPIEVSKPDSEDDFDAMVAKVEVISKINEEQNAVRQKELDELLNEDQLNEGFGP